MFLSLGTKGSLRNESIFGADLEVNTTGPLPDLLPHHQRELEEAPMYFTTSPE